MNIQYYGHSCFKITTKPAGRATEDVVIFIDPFDKAVGLRPPQGQAGIVFVSHDHFDHNNTAALKGDPVIINTPGEYSIKGINAIGIDTSHDAKDGAERGRNVVFVLESEDIKVCHLGDLGVSLTSEQLEKINGIDILLIPVGGHYTIDGKVAAEIVRKIEPSIVIPTHYKIKGSKVNIANEKKFCDEMGNCPKNKTSKLNIKKKDLEGKNEEVIIMNIE
ncbi:metal-dependent hydrolase [bacterium BMS3Abin15]|nr:metal-dependent hydrolase [bacterium BMS3Abin15]HDZ85046.1 MBL fold metallo-hydrolase [Candidatus Moranbacteria bacterium]